MPKGVTIKLYRAAAAGNLPPATLEQGELALDALSDPPRLYTAVPTARDPSGRIDLLAGLATAGVIVSATAPTALDGQLWFDSVSLTMFIRYRDDTGSQWVSVAGGGGTTTLDSLSGTGWLNRTAGGVWSVRSNMDLASALSGNWLPISNPTYAGMLTGARITLNNPTSASNLLITSTGNWNATCGLNNLSPGANACATFYLHNDSLIDGGPRYAQIQLTSSNNTQVMNIDWANTYIIGTNALNGIIINSATLGPIRFSVGFDNSGYNARIIESIDYTGQTLHIDRNAGIGITVSNRDSRPQASAAVVVRNDVNAAWISIGSTTYTVQGPAAPADTMNVASNGTGGISITTNPYLAITPPVRFWLGNGLAVTIEANNQFLIGGDLWYPSGTIRSVGFGSHLQIAAGAHVVGPVGGLYWQADAATAAMIELLNGQVRFYSNGGLTQGGAFNPSIYMTADLTGLSAPNVYAADRIEAGVHLISHTWRMPWGGYGGSYYWHWNPANGDMYWHTDGGQFIFCRRSDLGFFNFAGPVGGHGWWELSDLRFKSAVEPERHGLDVVRCLQPIDFSHIAHIPDPDPLPLGQEFVARGASRDDPPVKTSPPPRLAPRRQIGFSAQEVQAVLPEAVVVVGAELPDGSGGIDSANPTLGVNTTALIAMCVNAIKELDQRLAALEINGTRRRNGARKTT